MTDIEFYEKTKQVISRFKNGQRLYNESATFNKAVQCLVRDMDIYDLLEQVIQNSEDISKAFAHHLNNGNISYLVNRADICEINFANSK